MSCQMAFQKKKERGVGYMTIAVYFESVTASAAQTVFCSGSTLDQASSTNTFHS